MVKVTKDKLIQIIPTDLALWSLTVAVLALSFNAFFSQKAEANLNTRQAAFELILQIGELNNIVSQVAYNNADKETELINGWSRILMIEDLSLLLPTPIPTSAQRLKSVWGKNHRGLSGDKASVEKIRASIDEMRLSLQTLLTEL